MTATKKKTKGKKRVNTDRAAQQVIIGQEPEWVTTKDDLKLALKTSYNWYHFMSTPKERKKWVLEYMKSEGFTTEDCKAVKSLNLEGFADWRLKPRIRSYQARMIKNGCPLPDEDREALNDEIEKYIDIANKRQASKQFNKEEKSQIPKPSVQERLKVVQSEYIEAVEEKIDEWIVDPRKEPDFNVYEWLSKDESAKPAHARAIAEWFEENYLPELKEVVNAKGDTETGYSHLKPAQRRKFYNLCKSIAEDSRAWADNKKKRRQTKRKKSVSAARKIKGLKFKETDKSLKIGSVSPTKIVGASQVVAYDVDKRKVRVYVAKDKSGLDVKGTTIINFDESKSYQKTVRQQYLDDVLKVISEQGKRAIKKKLNAVKSKPQTVKGRTNSNLVIMRTL